MFLNSIKNFKENKKNLNLEYYLFDRFTLFDIEYLGEDVYENKLIRKTFDKNNYLFNSDIDYLYDKKNLITWDKLYISILENENYDEFKRNYFELKYGKEEVVIFTSKNDIDSFINLTEYKIKENKKKMRNNLKRVRSYIFSLFYNLKDFKKDRDYYNSQNIYLKSALNFMLDYRERGYLELEEAILDYNNSFLRKYLIP